MDNIFDKRPVIELTMKPFYEIRKIKKDEKGNNTYEEWAETIGAYIVAEKEKFILDKLYDICKEKDISTLYVINKIEFKKFLLKYLPIYIQEKQDNEKND